jgi:hypothetical protein
MIQATSVNSKQANAVIRDQFDLKCGSVVSVCDNNLVTFDALDTWTYNYHFGSSLLSEVTYLIGDTEVNQDPKYSASENPSDCPIVAQL